MADDDRKFIEEQFMKTLTEYFSRWPTGFYSQIGNISGELTALNSNIQASSKSSGELAKRIHQATVAAVIVASLALSLELYKTCFP